MFPNRFEKRKTTTIMVSIFVLLLMLHLFHLYLFYATDTYIRLLDFNYEHNIPTFFAALNLVFSGYLLLYVARRKGRTDYRRSWFALSFIFFFLAIDEYGMVHDGLAKNYRADLVDYDFLYFVWVIPYGILLIVFFAAFLKFFLNLPKKYQWLFGLSGSLFVLGAFGFEIIGAPRAKNYAREDYLNILFTTTEESLEFIGIIVFNYSLMTYIEDDSLDIHALGDERGSGRPMDSS